MFLLLSDGVLSALFTYVDEMTAKLPLDAESSLHAYVSELGGVVDEIMSTYGDSTSDMCNW